MVPNTVVIRFTTSIDRTSTNVVRHNLTGVHDNAPLEVICHNEADVEIQKEINHKNRACNRACIAGSVCCRSTGTGATQIASLSLQRVHPHSRRRQTSAGTTLVELPTILFGTKI